MGPVAQLHPASLLAGWAVAAVAVPHLDGSLLAAAAASSCLMGAAMAGGHLRPLMRRMRWLILTVVVLYAFATPGEYLEGWPGDAGLTRDGLIEGGEHLLRLLTMLSLLALVLEACPRSRLVAGLHGMALPLAWLGFDRDRAAIRLLMVLQYVEGGPPAGKAGWRHWMDASDAAGDAPETRFPRPPVGPLDLAWNGLLVAFLVVLGMRP